jgi:uncharacterized membrane protein YfcA
MNTIDSTNTSAGRIDGRMPYPLLALVGFSAGGLTTLAGQGGGLLAVLVLSMVVGPRTALLITAPAFLLGNLHRLWLYRQHLDRGVARAFLIGAAPASLLGGALAMAVPGWLIQLTMLATTILAVLRTFGRLRLRPDRRLLGSAGAGIGFLTAASAGAGFLIAPLFLAVGLSGKVYMATAAACSAGLHLTRLSGYLLHARPTVALVSGAATLGLMIMAGNLTGDRLRSRLSVRQGRCLELGTIVASAGFSLMGVPR